MRWLIAHPGPSFSVADVYTGWAEALTALGEDVAVFNLDNRIQLYDAALLETGTFDENGYPQLKKALTAEQAINLAATGFLNACYTWWPDVVLLVSAFFTPVQTLELMHARGHKIVLLHTEAPYEDKAQLVRAAHADINLLNDPATLDSYRALGTPAAYMPHAYRPELHHPGPGRPQLECDLGFVGTAFDSRIQFFEAMDLDGLDVLLAGQWQFLGEESPLRKHVAHDISECLDNRSAAEIYRSARAGINFYRREGDGDYAGGAVAMGPREVEMAACGLFFLRDPRPECDEVFPMLPAFTTAEQASDLLRWYLAHPAERDRRAAAAREAVAPRTFDNNAKQLLALLDRQPVTL
jgi:spore maturation protein CgeB